MLKENTYVFSDHLADISPDFMSLFGNKLVIFGSHTQSGFSQIIFLMAISQRRILLVFIHVYGGVFYETQAAQ